MLLGYSLCEKGEEGEEGGGEDEERERDVGRIGGRGSEERR